MRERSTFFFRFEHVWWSLVILAAASTPRSAAAQTGSGAALTLTDAVQLALQNYPSLSESRARARAAEEGVGVARTAYLPRVDLLLQANRATHNNVFGLLLPQSVVPPISGPVLGTSSYDSVWSTAAGVLLSWDAVDFGVRKANVDAAHAQTMAARARAELTGLDVAAAAADAFLTVLASDEALRAARANVDRLEVFAESVRTLVRNELRPGADESRANAELAIAQNQLSQAVQIAEIARATLANAIGAAGTALALDTGVLARLPEVRVATTAALESHPAARVETAAIDVVRARRRALERSYFPRVSVQSAFSGRASGADVPGLPVRGDGLGLEVPNWAAGVSITFPSFEIFGARAKTRVEEQHEAAERARYDQTLQNLTTQEIRARALMTAAAAIARNTPLERTAATEAESRARVRYASGLASITEVAESQRLLAQAEADDALARLGVWRALLAAAQARGDLTPFLNQVGGP